MDADRINLIAYRVICIVISLFLLLGGFGFCKDHLYAKAGVSISAALGIAFMASLRPTSRWWTIVAIIFIADIMIIGYLNHA